MPGTFISNPPNRWRRRSRGSTTSRRSHFIIDADAGIPILTRQFGDTLKLVIEIAWGANLAASPSTWVWTDITSDARIGDGGGVSIVPGKADESSDAQPAEVNFQVNNSLGEYSTSPLGPNWPNVVRNTPVRVRAVLQGVSNSRFAGYATSFTPSWNTRGNYATVAIKANGVLRRLGQGKLPQRSALYRATTVLSPVAYWPMEEGDTSTLAYQINGSPNSFVFNPAGGAGTISFGQSTDLPGSVQAPVLGGGSGGSSVFLANVDPTPLATGWTVSWAQNTNNDVGNGTDLNIVCTGQFYDIFFGTSTITISNDTTSTTLYSLPNPANPFGHWHYYTFSAVQNGGSIIYSFYIDGVFQGGNSQTSTLTGIKQLVMDPPVTAQMAMGHMAIYAGNVTAAQASVANVALGFPNEVATDRISRLAIENGITASIPGATTKTMGVQKPDTVLNLMRECEQVDGGVLYDGKDFGISYYRRDLRENVAVGITLDATLGQLASAPALANDDQLIRNRWVISRSNGATQTYELTAGPQGSATVGAYEDSKTLNTPDDTSLTDQAGWRVNLGTASGYRYPNAAFSFHVSPELLSSWLSAGLFSRIQITNLHTIANQFSTDAVDLAVEGYIETIGQYTWDVVANTSSFDPWRITVLAADSGDTGEFLCRLESDGATAAATAAGSSSLTVTTPSGPLWTTTADDFPLYIVVRGIRVTVTNITGSSSNQTFTVDPATVIKDIRAGDAVTIWDETVLGL